MSSLKFRVWGLYGDEYTYIDKENRAEAESFWDRGCISILDGKHIIECGTDEDGEGEGCEYWYVEAVKAIEQYTGLKDKNGKEIYEGDIVKVVRSYGYGFLPKGAKAKIEFDEKELCYKLRCRGEFRLTAKKELEAIGNIHENPELLEAKNVC